MHKQITGLFFDSETNQIFCKKCYLLNKHSDSNLSISSLKEIEKNHIEAVLKNTNTLADAAEILGINMCTLWRKRKEYDIQLT